MFAKLEGKIRGDNAWTDIPTTFAQGDLKALLDTMRGHGFKVRETDKTFQIINPLTKQVECEYRIT